jgi:putative DNA primase/helicase
VAGGAHRTDSGNAVRLVRHFGRDLRHCHPWGKDLVWDGRRWRVDDTAQVERLAKETGRRIYEEAAAAEDPEERKALVRHATASESARALGAMVRLARSEPGVPVLPAELDAHRWLLNCANGTVDLTTGRLREPRREDLITKLCPTSYEPKATCPTWERVLSAVFGGNDALVDFVRRLLGHCLTGDVGEQVLPIWWGHGSNGKTTILNAVMEALGEDYAIKAAADLLMARKKDNHPTQLARLFGRRLVACVESEQDGRLDEALVKELTGSDPITARRMREDPWQFNPTHKLILCTNHKPKVRGTDRGIWRRQCLVPFTVSFWDPDKGEDGPAELRADKALPGRLREEYPGILAWMVRGCLEWRRDGMQTPDEVLKATEAYRGEQDLVGTFLAERCVTGGKDKCRAGVLYTAFQEWAKAGGEDKVPGRRTFGDVLVEKGFDKSKSNGIWYLGIALGKEEDDGPTPPPFPE